MGIGDVSRDTEAYVGDANGAASTGSKASLTSGGPIIIDAKNNGRLVTGALAAAKVAPSSSGGSSGSSWGVGISGDVSYNQVNDTTGAYLHDAVVQAAGLNVNATNDTEFDAFSGSVAIVLNSGTSAGIAGSYTQNILSGSTSAFLDNTSLALTGSLVVDAASEGQFYSISASGSLVTSGSGIAVAGQVSINSDGMTTLAEILDGSSVAANANNISLTATNNNKILAIAGAVAYGGEAGIGAAVATNTIGATAGAYLDDSNVTSADNVTLDAADSNGEIFSITAGGAGSQTFATGAAVSLNQVTNADDAYISDGSQVDASGAVSLTSSDAPVIEALAGGLAGSGTAAISAAFATNDIDDNTESYINGSSVTALTLALTAASTASIESLTVAGASSGTFALGGAVGLNSIGDVTAVYITNGSILDVTGFLTLTATDDPTITAGAGALDAAGTAAISAGVATNTIGDTVTAYIDGDTQVQTTWATLTATETASIEAASMGVAVSGTVAVTGGVGVNQIHNTTDVHISGGSSVIANNYVLLTAQDTSDNSSLTGQGAGSLVGIGGAVSYNVIGNHVRAYVQSATVSSFQGDVSIVALLTATINTITAGLSGGFVAVAGSVAVNLLGSDVSAYITASTVTAFLPVMVSAETTDQLQAIAGAASGGVVAASGTVVVDNMTNSTRAYIEDSTVAAANGEVDVLATSVEQPNPQGDGDTLAAVNLSGGLVGVGGVVSVNTVDDITQAFIASSQVNLSLGTSKTYDGTVTVKASSQVNLVVLCGAVSGGLVGASGTVDRTTIGSQTSAFISSNDESGSYAYPTAASVVYAYQVIVASVSNENIQRTIVGGAGGFVGVAGAVSVLNVNVADKALVRDSNIYSFRDILQGGPQEGNVSVTANDTTAVNGKVGTIAGGAVGAGASIDVNTIQNTIQAQVLGGHLNALNALTVAATSNESITPFTGTASVGAVALAGAVAVDTIDTTTQALVANGTRPSLINQEAGYQPVGLLAPLSDRQYYGQRHGPDHARTGSVSVGAVGAGAAIEVGRSATGPSPKSAHSR